MKFNFLIPCWQAAESTIVIRSASSTFCCSYALTDLYLVKTNSIAKIRETKRDSIAHAIHTNRLNGNRNMLYALDKGGCLKSTADLNKKDTLMRHSFFLEFLVNQTKHLHAI